MLSCSMGHQDSASYTHIYTCMSSQDVLTLMRCHLMLTFVALVGTEDPIGTGKPPTPTVPWRPYPTAVCAHVVVL